MGQNDVRLIYMVYLGDEAQVEQLNAEFPQGITIPPREASTLYDAPIQGIDPPGPEGSAIPPPPYILLSCGRAADCALGLDVTSVTYPANKIVDTDGVLRTPIPASIGTGGTISWQGYFYFSAPTAAAATPTLSSVRFQQGWELEENEEGTSAFMPSFDASRVTGHRGLALRSTVNNSGAVYTPPTDVYESQWTQFYIRPTIIAAQAEIYKTEGRTGANTTLSMEIGTDGSLLLYHSPGVKTLLATVGPIPLYTWTRIDIMENFNVQTELGANAGGTWDVYINKALVAQIQSSTANTQYIFQSILCRVNVGAGTAGMAIDFDDWTVRELPTGSFTDQLDWINGTHILPIRGSVSTANTSPNWTGTTGSFDAYRSAKGNVGMSCSTNSSYLYIDIAEFNVSDVQLGAVSAFVGVNNIAAVTGTAASIVVSGTFFVDAVSTLFTVSGTSTFTTTSLSASGTLADLTVFGDDSDEPLKPETLIIGYNPGTLSGTMTLTALHGTLACLGIWGTVDSPSGISTNFDPHQSVYPRLGFTGTQGVAPPALVAQEQGTYTGNGTITEITLLHPPTFIYIHRSGFEPVMWNSALETGRSASNHIVDCDWISRVRTNIDPLTQVITGFTVRICGSDSQTNANGATYRYITFCDPGGRFNRNTITTQADNNLATTKVTALKDFQFTPEGGFLQYATTGITSVSTTYYKGVGHTSEAASLLNAAETASVASFSQGGLTLDTNGFSGSEDHHIIGNLWRSSDGTYDGAMDMVTYTGDGTASKVVAVDLNGNIPALAIVIPHSGVATAHHKNASLTSTTSQVVTTGASTATGITALGADSVTVGLTLNANLVVYDVFVISGGATGADAVVYPVPTTNAPAGPYVPQDPNGWWLSTEGFTGSVTIIESTDRPYAPRDWTKLADWASGGSTYLGGFPAASAVFNNHIIYPANGYVRGTNQPPMRIFDGITDRELVTIPITASAAIPKAILSMLRNGDIIYVSTYDSGTTAADFAGRVFSYDVLANTLTPLGSGFSSGEIPYAMCWHMGRLWLGTNKGNGTTGKIYFIRPGIDTDWTLDYTLSSSTTGGCTSLASYGGQLYVGTDNAAASFAKVLVRSTLGVYTTSLTATGGTARVNNGFPYLIVRKNALGVDQLIASYWNPDTTSVAKIYKFDGTTWTTPYTGSSGSLRPYILMFPAVDNLYILGGAKDRSAFMMRTDDLITYTDLTSFLYGPITETIIPTFGVV